MKAQTYLDAMERTSMVYSQNTVLAVECEVNTIDAAYGCRIGMTARALLFYKSAATLMPQELPQPLIYRLDFVSESGVLWAKK